jgi:hypothetical protein
MAAYVAGHPELVPLGFTPLEHRVRLSTDPRLHD